MVDLSLKLSPTRFAGMSPKMAAIVGCILGEPFTRLRMVEMVRTSDNFIMGMVEGDIGHNEFIGSGEDLDRNWTALLDVAGLTEDERRHADGLFVQHIRRC